MRQTMITLLTIGICCFGVGIYCCYQPWPTYFVPPLYHAVWALTAIDRPESCIGKTKFEVLQMLRDDEKARHEHRKEGQEGITYHVGNWFSKKTVAWDMSDDDLRTLVEYKDFEGDTWYVRYGSTKKWRQNGMGAQLKLIFKNGFVVDETWGAHDWL